MSHCRTGIQDAEFLKRFLHEDPVELDGPFDFNLNESQIQYAVVSSSNLF